MTNADVFADPTVEWKLLNKLLDVTHRDYINRLSPKLFTGDRATTHKAMQETFTKYGTITYDGLDQAMQGKVPGELTAATGGDLQTLIDQSRRLARRRIMKQKSEEYNKLAAEYDPKEDAIRAVQDIELDTDDEDTSLTLGVQSFLGNLHAKRSGDYIYAHTGYKCLDRHMGGEWKPKSVVLLAGGAGSGKTTLWMNSQKAMAKGYTNRHGEIIQTASLFISLEMSREDLILKMVADELSINNTDLLAGNFENILVDNDNFETEDELIAAIEDKTAELQQLPMYIAENSDLTLHQMVQIIRKHIRKYNVRVVAIDYLQIANHHPTNNKNYDLGDFVRVLKALAKKENITVVIFSQVNRLGEGLDAIRDSGEVEAVVDVVIQLLPEAEDNLSLSTDGRCVNMGWWKNRLGPSNRKTPILFNGAYQRFKEA